jgi:4-amino-4-deoxy-L-arabinose transferase-like glycosyltransferase
MLAILPLCAYLEVFCVLGRLRFGWRYSLLLSSVTWTMYLCVLTEALSSLNLLTKSWLAAGWALLCFVLVLIFLFVLPAKEGADPPKKSLTPWFRSVPLVDRGLFLGVCMIVLLVGVTALISPPNGGDQMEYHMPRVYQWSLQHSIAFFPTHYYVQLFSPPLSEWIMLHFYILFGGDRLVNLVQWFAFFASLVGLSLAAEYFGAGLRGQILAVVFGATMPPGILSASGAKDGWVLTLWMVTLVIFFLHWSVNRSWIDMMAIGGSLGAAMLTKGTAYFFLPPVFVALFFCLRSCERSRFLRRVPVAILLAVLVNLPQWIRNYSLAGSPYGMSAPDVAGVMKYSVDRLSVGTVAANLVKKTSLNFALPTEQLNEEVTKLFRGLILFLGQNPDDPSTNLHTAKTFQIPRLRPDEYWAGSPIHVLVVALISAITFLDRKRSSPRIAIYLAGILLAYLFFSAVLRWDPSGARLQIPLLALCSAPVGVVFLQRFPRLVVPLAATLLVVAMPFALLNEARPLVSRSWFGLPEAPTRSIFREDRGDLYFAENEYMEIPYRTAANEVRKGGCRDIGLDTSHENFSIEAADYPLFALISPGSNGPSIRYAGVENLSLRYAREIDRREPCVVLCVRCTGDAQKLSRYQSLLPNKAVFGDLIVFSSQPLITEQPIPK